MSKEKYNRNEFASVRLGSQDTPEGPPELGQLLDPPEIDADDAMRDIAGDAPPASLCVVSNDSLGVSDAQDDTTDGEPWQNPKYLVECPGCGTTHNARHLTKQDRRLMRRALCRYCAGVDESYTAERGQYIRRQSGHVHDPETQLSAHADYVEPSNRRLIDEIAACDALRRSMGLSASGFICERHGQLKGLIVVDFPSSTLLPNVPEDRIALDFVVGIDRDALCHVVVALCFGFEAGEPVYCLDRDVTQAELAAILNVWPQHLSTEINHSTQAGWRMLRQGRYRIKVGKSYLYYFPSHLVAKVLVGNAMFLRLQTLVRKLVEGRRRA